MKKALLAIGLLVVIPALAESRTDRGPPADVLAVRNVEVTFHTAGSVLPERSLDLMMSIYADDAVLTDTAHDNKLYRGKEELRMPMHGRGQRRGDGPREARRQPRSGCFLPSKACARFTSR
jgi:hypothetical protein